MSESTDPQTRATPKPEEMPWVISYLHDDIQDLRQDLRTQVGAVNNRIDELNRSLGDRINETNNGIDEPNRSLGDRINETNNRIDELNRSLSEQIRALHKRYGHLFPLDDGHVGDHHRRPHCRHQALSIRRPHVPFS